MEERFDPEIRPTVVEESRPADGKSRQRNVKRANSGELILDRSSGVIKADLQGSPQIREWREQYEGMLRKRREQQPNFKPYSGE